MRSVRFIGLILGANVQRITFLIFFVFVSLTTSLYAESESQKYIFPEVWDWRPKILPKEGALVNFWKFENDILISCSGLNEAKSETIAFFSRHKFKSPEEAFGVLPGAVHPDPIIDHSAKLPNGKTVSVNPGSYCSEGIGAKLTVYDSQNNLFKTTSLVLVLDKPWRSPDVICEESKKSGSYQRYIVFQPYQAIPLSDNTFLVSDIISGTVIRFDENLNTKSSLFGKYLFLIDPILLENRIKAPRHKTTSDDFFKELCLESKSNRVAK